jgi:hypothetical protein
MTTKPSLHAAAVLQIAAPAGCPVLLITSYQRLRASSVHQAQGEQRTAAQMTAGMQVSGNQDKARYQQMFN